MTPKKFSRVFPYADKVLNRLFRLPPHWRLAGFTLAEYRSAIGTLWILAGMHYAARLLACEAGCVNMGYLNSIIVADRNSLVSRVARYSGLSKQTAKGIIEQLTFGMGGVKQPDVALQPVVPLTQDRVAIAPNLIMNSALERNLLVLLNKTVPGRKDYSHLSDQREEFHRQGILQSLEGTHFRFWNGNVPTWDGASEIDLAIIDDKHRSCLLLELKTSIAPADAREVYDKSLEIARGIEQVRKRKSMARQRRDALHSVLQIEGNYTIYGALASESHTACGMARAKDVPVVRSRDLVART